MIEFRHVKEHIEVYEDGVFVVSADNESEARQFLREMKVENG